MPLKLHPRAMICQVARIELNAAIREVANEHKLTIAELAHALSLYLAEMAGSCIKQERAEHDEEAGRHGG